MEEKIIEMLLNTANDAMKFIMSHADAAFGSRHLDPDERTVVKHGVHQLKIGLGRVLSGDAMEREEGARLVMLGAFKIGLHAAISASVINYRNAEKHGPGGAKTGAANHARAEEWHSFVRWWLAANKPTGKPNATALTKKLLKEQEKAKPGSVKLPEFEWLVRFVRKELKAPVRGNAIGLRIVHG